MIVGIPKKAKSHEWRIAIVPAGVTRLVSAAGYADGRGRLPGQLYVPANEGAMGKADRRRKAAGKDESLLAGPAVSGDPNAPQERRASALHNRGVVL